MSTFRLNIAHIRGCPPPQQVSKAMESFGLPNSEEFGVLNCRATEQAVFATIIRRTNQAIQRLDASAGEVTSEAVEKVTAYPFAIRPSAEVVEIYEGPASAIEQVGVFMSGCLALPTVVEAIEIDIPSAIEKLTTRTSKFQLRTIRVSDYAHNSYMSGPYSPKFLDTQHGKDFMDEYAEYVQSASVRFQGPTSRATAKLSSKACFSYSCNEDDQPEVQAILRGLV